ncbi:ribosome maturation factor RimP [Desulfacinum infernum DSM 9756]|uniref:Ribosome maturation factor RimP n=1 Tax=Desulfacinum infernum DSM 9756 TaxID=1121391 RepID=A0A1M4VD28_9BACT|nr:ribosome maturation factor RimP [Desulfacinum infernum]SHE66823.1 ribosome maturation factor RimP [Desulfacinum infernum DSM 9756]
METSEDRSRQIVERIWSLATPVIRAEGLELIEVEYRRESQGWVLRLFVDGEDGVTVEDCAVVSRVVGDLLDVEDPISGPYHLEVSSPGLDRPLRRWEHFQAHLGMIVFVRTREALEGRKNFKGTLVDARPETIQMDCDGNVYEIALDNIERARLRYFESQEGSKRSPT